MSEQQTNKDKPAAETSKPNEKSTGNGRRDDRRGDRRSDRRGNRRPRQPEPEKIWLPRTRLGTLVQSGSVQSLDTIFQNGWKIKEYEIVLKSYKQM